MNLGRSSALIASGTAVSRVTGLVRNILLVALIGSNRSAVADAFDVANNLPNSIFELVYCKGSYLQKYINGSMVANYALVYDGGGYYSDVAPFPYGCAIALAGAYLLVLYPPTSGVAWVLQGSVAAGGLATSCVA